jgi:hypothetical protein
MSDSVIVLPCSTCGSRLEIPSTIGRFVCIHCGCEQVVHRSGGIVGLTPVMHGEHGGCLDAYGLAVNQLFEKIRDLKIEHERTIQAQRLDVPAYVLLRFDFQRIGKLSAWNVSQVSQAELERLFRALTMDELEKLIKIYSRNRQSPTYAWLVQVRDQRKQLTDLEQELNRLKASAGISEP